MTGANRLLIGFMWPLIVELYWFKTRNRELVLEPRRSVELVYLSLATLYSFVIPLKGTISLLDTVVLIAIFVAYAWRIAQGGVDEVEVEGPAAAIAKLRPPVRRTAAIAMFLYSATIILAAAEPFAESLIATGRELGVDEFILVQWLAPFASEAPEASIACVLTLRGDAQAGMGAMVSSKINQWTLLIGTMAIAYGASAGSPVAIPLNDRQQGEIMLTAAQSLFAVAVLSNLRLSLGEAAALFVLFTTQLALPIPWVHTLFSWLYLVLGVAVILVHRKRMVGFLRGGLFPGAEARG
jgi:cation:H+ antiporter